MQVNPDDLGTFRAQGHPSPGKPRHVIGQASSAIARCFDA
jgi:hypothetical protein